MKESELEHRLTCIEERVRGMNKLVLVNMGLATTILLKLIFGGNA